MRLIDADALLDEVMDRYCEECDKRKGIKNGRFRIIYEIGDAPCRACEIDDVKAELEDAPTIDPVEHGRWIEENRRPKSSQFYCSECHRTAYDIQPSRAKGWVKKCRYAFCPNCGAKMDEVSE